MFIPPPLTRLNENLLLRNCAVSAGLIILATGFTWLAWSYSQVTPYAFYYLAAVLAGFYGGWRSGALTTLIGALLGDYFFIPPFYSWQMLHDIKGIVHVAVFMAVSALMVGLVASLRRTQERVLDKERQLSLFIEHAPAAVAMFDHDMRYLAASRRWLSDYQLEDTVLGLSHYEVFPELPEAWKEVHRRALAGETLSAQEDRFKRLDGKTHFLHWEVRPWLYRNDTIGGIVIFAEDITERKQAEQALRESEEKLRSAFASAAIGFVISRADGRFLDANPAYSRLTGYPIEELRNLDSRLLIHPDDYADNRLWVDRMLTGGCADFVIENRYIRKGGEALWVRKSISLVRDEEGAPRFLIALVEDISERKQAEQALQESELRFRALVEQIGDVFWISDPTNRKLIYVSRTFADIWGRKPEDLYNHFDTWLDAILDDDRARVAKDFYGNILTGTYNTEYRIIRPDGSIRWIRDRGKPLGIGTLVAGVAEDITERKKAELATAQLAAIIISSSDAIISKDLNGIVSSWNFSAERLFGYTAKEMIGRTIRTIIPSDHVQEEDRILESIQRGERLDNFETVRRRKDGTLVEVSVTISPIKDKDGQIVGASKIVQDITERRCMEKALRESEEFIYEILHAFPVHIAAIDAQGFILFVNEAWLRYAEENGVKDLHKVSVGANYLEVCRKSSALGDKDAPLVLNGIEAVLTGSSEKFVLEYECFGYWEKRWFSMFVVQHKQNNAVGVVIAHHDITERKLAEEQINKLAFYDPLTLLANRRLMQDRLKHGIDRARRHGKQLALLMLDLDRFKPVNDSLGHQAGDELLQQVAVRMAEKLREADLVARMGGDEFTVLLEDIDHVDDAARVAEGIIFDLSQPFCLANNKDVQIAASIGISLYPQHGDSPEILLDHADAALYLAKSQGRGCCAYFSEDITRSVRAHIALEAKLRKAIKKQELLVYYQPQIDILSGRIIGAEALVRWQDPKGGIMFPNDFIPIAEETHLIVEIGEWVLQETCQQGRQWLDRGYHSFSLAVNVSPHQFRQSDINALVAKVLAETGFPAGQLELEITESGLMENQDKAMEILNNLRAQGVRLAIDDFGTGYSSLAYLKRFPLDVLKIDKGFIDEIPDNKEDMEIATTIVAVGHNLGLKVTAEGVETPGQLAFLRKIGCDAYQGFVKSHPIPAEKFTEFFHAHPPLTGLH